VAPGSSQAYLVYRFEIFRFVDFLLLLSLTYFRLSSTNVTGPFVFYTTHHRAWNCPVFTGTQIP